MNTDGSSTSNGSVASAGGLVRNAEGQWKGGFLQNIGIGSAIRAEL